jgi:hypothetical protein
MARKATNRFKPVALAYSAPSLQHQTQPRTRCSYTISIENTKPTNPPSRCTGEFIGCALAWDESGNPLVSATVNGTPVPPATLQVFKTRGKQKGRISTTFVLDLPGGPIATRIEVVIDTKPLFYGGVCKTKPSLLLTWDSGPPWVIEFDPAPVFYNAFPDLNGVAEDGSYSAAPKGAKYMLPLDCIFNPYATFEELHDAHPLATLPGYRRLREEHGEDYKLFAAMPRKPELERAFDASALFEEGHARLAAAQYKWMFRADLLGPFYNTLWDWLSSERTVRVPLVANPNGSELQRQWYQIKSWFLETCLLDEACSLLVEVAFIIDKQGRKQDERRWVQAEDQEMQGKFAPFYRKFRSKAELLYGGSLDDCSTESERFTFAEVALTCGSIAYEGMAATGTSDPEPFLDGNNAWAETPPSDHEPVEAFFDRLQSLCERLGVLQVELGLQLMRDEVQQSWTTELSFGPNASPEIIRAFWKKKGRRRFPQQYFFSESGITKEGVSFISVAPTTKLIDLLASSGSAPPGDRQFKQFSSELKAMYTIFLESIRQQICQGVGLRCPFWNGECCQRRGFRKGFRELLEQTYKITKPWKWPQYWQKPPCL